MSNRDLGARLAPALYSVDVPAKGPELVKAAGGRHALAQQLSGMDGPPRRAAYDTSTPQGAALYKADQTRWRTASRRAQRYDDAGKSGKQTRGGSKVVLAPSQRERVEEGMRDRKLSLAIKRGLRVRLTVRMRVSSPSRAKQPDRLREIPAGGPGVYIPPPDDAGYDEANSDDILMAAESGNDEGAGATLLQAVFESEGWGLSADDVEVTEVVSVHIWPDGADEADYS